MSLIGDDEVFGDDAVTNDNSVIGDDAVFGDNAVTSDNSVIDSDTVIGDDAMFGENAVTRDNSVFGNDTMIGDGAVYGDDAVMDDFNHAYEKYDSVEYVSDWGGESSDTWNADFTEEINFNDSSHSVVSISSGDENECVVELS